MESKYSNLDLHNTNDLIQNICELDENSNNFADFNTASLKTQ